MKKIVIIGSTLSGNKGAAAMLESSIQTLSKHYPDAKFSLLSYIPTEEENTKNTYNSLTVLRATPIYLGVVINSLALMYRLVPPARLLLRNNNAIKALAEADVLLDQGGITFVDGREKFLLYNVASILPAMLMGIPVVKCAQALGPFNNKINLSVAKIILPRVKAIVSRGSITHSNLKSLGLNNVVEGADYAFLLKLSSEQKKQTKKYYEDKFFDYQKIVGLSPSVVISKKLEASDVDYIAIMAKFVDYLIQEKGYRVMLLAHSARKNTTKTHNNDLPMCREIYQAVNNKPECLFVDQELESQELRFLISKCDLFVASRFHAMVSALAMRVPTLVIGWSHKYREVLEMFELEDWAFGHDKLSEQYLIKRFSELELNQVELKYKLSKNLPIVEKLAYKQVDAIKKIIENR